jgi:hypothetical protein
VGGGTRRYEIGRRDGDSENYILTICDKNVRRRVKRRPNEEDREATTKQWMGRIGDLD